MIKRLLEKLKLIKPQNPKLVISDVIGCIHPAVNNTTNKCIICGKDWNKDLGKL